MAIVSRDQVQCAVCGAMAELVNNEVIYGHPYGQHPYAWLCPVCGAYVGTHPDNTPLGALCNQDTRDARRAAHHVFDQLWYGSNPVFDSRGAAYRWLAQALGVTAGEAHIGTMDIPMAERVLDLSIEKLAARRSDNDSKVRQPDTTAEA